MSVNASPPKKKKKKKNYWFLVIGRLQIQTNLRKVQLILLCRKKFMKMHAHLLSSFWHGNVPSADDPFHGLTCEFLITGSSQNQQLLQLLRDCYMVLPANLTPTVHPPCKASNPTASQNQQLLQLLRDCYIVIPANLTPTVHPTMQSFKSYCFLEPTIIATPKRLLHSDTRKPYSYCTSTMQSFKSYLSAHIFSKCQMEVEGKLAVAPCSSSQDV